MTEWPEPSLPPRPGPVLPPGIEVAGTGTRLAAWAVDSVIFGAFLYAFVAVAEILGAIRINPAVDAELKASPFALPSVSAILTNLPQLAALVAIFVLLNVAYAAVCWTRFRGLPGQRMLSLQVGAADSGRNLSIKAALFRSIVAVGVPFAAGGAFTWGTLAMSAAVPWAQLQDPQPGGPAEAWVLPLLLLLLVAVGWPLVMFAWTVNSPTKQGPHDRLAGSLVVAKSKLAWRFGPAPDPNRGYGPGYGAYPGALPTGLLGSPDVRQPGESADEPAGLASERPPVGPTDRLPVGPVPSGDAAGLPAVAVVTIGRRVAAYLFDCAVVLIVFLTIVEVAAAVFLNSATILDERTYILFFLAGGALQIAYFTVGWVVWKGTPGQRLMHMRVTDAATGKGLSWMDALARWAVMQGPFALATIVPLAAQQFMGPTAAAWTVWLLYSTMKDPDHRGLHDRFVNSHVTLGV